MTMDKVSSIDRHLGPACARFLAAALSVAFAHGVLPLSAAPQSRSAAPRDSYEQPAKVIEATGVKPGMVIGEVGAGGGHFTFWLASAVGAKGKIYANDILRSAIDKIDRRAAAERVTNIETVLGTVDDPRLPTAALDMVFMVESFHEIEKPVELLGNLLRSLKPDATVVIMERDPQRWGRVSEHLYTVEEMSETIGRSVFELVRTETFLRYHNLYILKARK